MGIVYDGDGTFNSNDEVPAMGEPEGYKGSATGRQTAKPEPHEDGIPGTGYSETITGAEIYDAADPGAKGYDVEFLDRMARLNAGENDHHSSAPDPQFWRSDQDLATLALAHAIEVAKVCEWDEQLTTYEAVRDGARVFFDFLKNPADSTSDTASG
jgi:hypothetical protein